MPIIQSLFLLCTLRPLLFNLEILSVSCVVCIHGINLGEDIFFIAAIVTFLEESFNRLPSRRCQIFAGQPTANGRRGRRGRGERSQ